MRAAARKRKAEAAAARAAKAAKEAAARGDEGAPVPASATGEGLGGDVDMDAASAEANGDGTSAVVKEETGGAGADSRGGGGADAKGEKEEEDEAEEEEDGESPIVSFTMGIVRHFALLMAAGGTTTEVPKEEEMESFSSASYRKPRKVLTPAVVVDVLCELLSDTVEKKEVALRALKMMVETILVVVAEQHRCQKPVPLHLVSGAVVAAAYPSQLSSRAGRVVRQQAIPDALSPPHVEYIFDARLGRHSPVGDWSACVVGASRVSHRSGICAQDTVVDEGNYGFPAALADIVTRVTHLCFSTEPQKYMVSMLLSPLLSRHLRHDSRPCRALMHLPARNSAPPSQGGLEATCLILQEIPSNFSEVFLVTALRGIMSVFEKVHTGTAVEAQAIRTSTEAVSRAIGVPLVLTQLLTEADAIPRGMEGAKEDDKEQGKSDEDVDMEEGSKGGSLEGVTWCLHRCPYWPLSSPSLCPVHTAELILTALPLCS